jgi:hypothetical protein
MNLKISARNLYLNDRLLQCLLLTFMFLYYGALLYNAGVYVESPPLNRTFNSMLDHFVQGRFDVDPNTVGDEGFLRNGHVYAYWGITCALLRLPLLLFHRMDMDVTLWSCLVAVCLAGAMKIKTVLFLRRYCGAAPASDLAFGLMLSYILLGGAGIGYLRSSIYQEVIFWAIAFASVFVYFAVKGLVSGQFTLGALSWMAFAAGLALLTRVSTGIGLCTAFGLLLLVLLAAELRARRVVFTRSFLIPAAILALLCIAVGAVNFYRWGSPWTFADHTFYLKNIPYPDRMPRTRLYGYFNLSRIPFGLGYFFLPIWVLRGANGLLLFENTQTRLMDAVELPPSSFFLTDLLPIAFIAFLAIALWTARPVLSRALGKGVLSAWQAAPLPSSRLFSYAQALALAAGLAVPCLLMLTAISMNYRYRMEFYPEIDLLAFLGLYATVSNPVLLARFNRCRRWMLAAAILSIVSAFAIMVLYKLADLGPAQNHLRNGIIHFYMYDAWRQ